MTRETNINIKTEKPKMTIESNSTTKNDILQDLINIESGETIRFTGGRRPVEVTYRGGIRIEGISKVFQGEKVAAATVAAYIR